MLELSFLGSGSAFSRDGRYWSSFVLNRRYLFDAGPTTLPHLRQLGIATNEIEVVFVSHFHGDHFAGLPFLLLDYRYVTPRERDLTIIGPPGCEKFLESFTAMCYAGLANRDSDAYRRCYIEADPGSTRQAGDITFEAVEVPHGAPLRSFGYRATVEGGTVAYTGDSEYSEAVLELGRGAEVLVVDCTHAEPGPDHMGFADAQEMRRQLPPETVMILTHRDHDPDVTGLQNVVLAHDLQTYRF